MALRKLFSLRKKGQTEGKTDHESALAIGDDLLGSPGIKTSEFWIVVAMLAFGSVETMLPQSADSPPWMLMIGAGSAVLYKMMRFFLKLKRSQYIIEVESTKGELEETMRELRELLKQAEQPIKPLRATPVVYDTKEEA